MERHWRLSDSEFEAQFKNSTFRPLRFSHEAHLRLAWILIKKYQATKAYMYYKDQLWSFAQKYKAETKFNLTITYASIKIMDVYMSNSNSQNFKEFIAEFPELKTNFKSLLKNYYSKDIFTSLEAKKQIIEPDLHPF